MIKLILIIWFLIGWAICSYYVSKNMQEYEKHIEEGKLTLGQLALGCFLTIVLWPITIFNQERDR